MGGWPKNGQVLEAESGSFVTVDVLSAWTSWLQTVEPWHSGVTKSGLIEVSTLGIPESKVGVWLMTFKCHEIERIQSFYETKSHLQTDSKFILPNSVCVLPLVVHP